MTFPTNQEETGDREKHEVLPILTVQVLPIFFPTAFAVHDGNKWWPVIGHLYDFRDSAWNHQKFSLFSSRDIRKTRWIYFSDRKTSSANRPRTLPDFLNASTYTINSFLRIPIGKQCNVQDLLSIESDNNFL